MYWCPGCNHAHGIVIGPNGWTFDGNYDAPTFNPSVLVTGGHYSNLWKQGDPCWCTFNAERPNEKPSFVCNRCHVFVRGGTIQFLGDCTHALAGQTVPMVVPDHWRDDWIPPT